MMLLTFNIHDVHWCSMNYDVSWKSLHHAAVVSLCSVSQFQFLHFTKSFGGLAWSLQVPGLGFGVSFTCWTSCVACEGWHGATDCQRASSRVGPRVGSGSGKLETYLAKRSSKSDFMFHLFGCSFNCDCHIWIMNIHESCVWPFQKMKGVFFFLRGGGSRAQWFNEGRKWWKLTLTCRRRDPLATETRRSQLRSAFRHLDRMQTELQISSDETATIVAGDFNDLAGSSLHQDLQKGLFDKTSRSMVDAYGHLSTAPATFRAAGRADRIDFIYHTKNLETQSLRWPLSPEEEDRLKWSFRWPPWPALIPGDWYPSDHVPIAALFSFKAWFSRT